MGLCMSRQSSKSEASTEDAQIHIGIVGAGIGGLACAIACRRASPPMKVTVFERVQSFNPIVNHLGLANELKKAQAYSVEGFTLRRYKDGEVIVEKPMGKRMEQEYGADWLAIHRGDYQRVLFEAAKKAGAVTVLGADVISIERSTEDAFGRQDVVLKSGQRFAVDVVVGADGLWSILRETVLGRAMPPLETGDLAYRGTFTREQLEAFNNEQVDELVKASNVQVWLGEDRHAVFYPIRDHTEYNLVLVCVDDLSKDVRTSEGSLEDLAANFVGWDPILTTIISCLKSALKWKLLHFKELDQWTKGPIALLGDASHPTLPYQGQGAAMAVEDGAVLGLLLSRLQDSGLATDPTTRCAQIEDLLHLYEALRKKRTEVNVAGAVDTRHYYHLHDGEEQIRRDKELAGLPALGWQGPCSFNWGDATYQKSMLGFDVLADAEYKFQEWNQKRQRRSRP